MDTSASERVTLSRELSDFLIEFSIALHRHAMYPEEHPSLRESATAVLNHLVMLLDDRGTVSLGVARRQLVIEGVATDVRHPVLSALAERLHGHQVGAVTFKRGVTSDEVLDVLRLLAEDPERDAMPIGSGDPSRLRAWNAVQLFPLTYSKLQLLDQGSEEGDDLSDEDRSKAHRSAQLWIGLARAAMAVSDEEEPESTDPGVVARAINEHEQARAYDQVIVGYLLQIAEELRTEGSVSGAALRRRMSRLISGLDGNTLNRLVEMGGDRSQRRRFMLDAAAGLSVDAVVELAQAAAETSGQTISNSMFRLLTKLSAAAASDVESTGEIAEGELRDQIRALIDDWSLDDPNPDAYTRALDAMTKQGPMQVARGAAMRAAHAADPMRLVYMSLETDSEGPIVTRAVDRVLSEEGPEPVVRALMASDGGGRVSELWQRVSNAASIERLLAARAPDFELVDALIARTPARTAVNALLSVLTMDLADDKHIRVRERVLAAGPACIPIIVSRLHEGEPEVQAQLLDLIADIGVLPANFSTAEYSRHADARVRLAALRLGLRFPAERERALCLGLTDHDPLAFEVALEALSGGAPHAAVPLMANRLSDPGLRKEDQAVLLRGLASSRSTIALTALLRAATNGRDLFGRPRVAHKSPPVLAALEGLAGTWSQHRRAAAVLRRASRSKDGDIRRAAASDREEPAA